MILNTFKRLADKIDIQPGGCWLWTGKLQDGYGITSFTGKPKIAHRVVYSLLVGSISEGLVLDHLYRIRSCVNPAHLEPVTQSVNTTRGDHWQRRKTVCPQGHLLIDTNRNILGRRFCIECRRAHDRKRCPRSKVKS